MEKSKTFMKYHNITHIITIKLKFRHYNNTKSKFMEYKLHKWKILVQSLNNGIKKEQDLKIHAIEEMLIKIMKYGIRKSNFSETS